MSRLLAPLLLSATLLLPFVGCSGGTAGAYPVTGKVTLSDGSPLTTGTITFSSDKHSASSPIGPDGTYKLGSATPGDGAIPGSYKVAVGGDAVGGGYDNKPPIIDKKYADPNTSSLTAEVKAQSNSFDFKVDKAP